MNKREQKIKALGCLVCRRQGMFTPAELHHIRKLATSKVRKKSPAIPLCSKHHLTGGYGTALHAGEKAFEANYGSIMGMLEEVEGMI